MKDKKRRTLREIMNLVKRLKAEGAVSIKINDVEATFLPDKKDSSDAETAHDLANIVESMSADNVQEKSKEDEDLEDLFYSS